ncbi:MAG: hypothetical protein QOH81_639 [Sphingomonadales bacterium]|nr:hypothetical protein [Sphingomonadales bacterium]
MRELCDKQELYELGLRYCRAVDRCDLELLLSCYHPDAVDDHGTFKGSPAEIFPPILDRFRSMPPMQHVLANALFEVDGDVAYGEVYMSVRMADGEAGSPPDPFGRNLDRYERRDGTWRIAERRVIIERWEKREGVDTSKFLIGRKDGEDPSYRDLGLAPKQDQARGR